MKINDKIRGDLKKSMIERDQLKSDTLKGLLAAFTNELVAKGRKPQEVLDENDCFAVIKRAVKQRKDSIEQFQKGGRADLALQEEKELEILKQYLPAEIGLDEIRKVALAKKEELGITDKSKIGILIGVVMKELKGQADGGEVKKIVEGYFS
ncbi:MAG: GatB/YqeY domain-containing protein [Candidatus Paceibacterota bacterium]|nr:MAG: GatB/YqeY domain-containing protein [Candidatus Paceibacterota bacterium]